MSRKSLLDQIRVAVARNPVTVLTGPRQSGKTTLARELLNEGSTNDFDLEDPVSLARLDEPKTALEPLRGLVVIDEVQRRSDLFPVLAPLREIAFEQRLDELFAPSHAVAIARCEIGAWESSPTPKRIGSIGSKLRKGETPDFDPLHPPRQRLRTPWATIVQNRSSATAGRSSARGGMQARRRAEDDRIYTHCPR